MFAHKDISHKGRGPTRSEKARHLLVWVYRERCVHIFFCVLSVLYTVYVLIFHRKTSLLPPLHNAMCSSESKPRACVLRTWLRFATERKKHTKPEFQFGHFPWKARVISNHKLMIEEDLEMLFKASFQKAQKSIFGSVTQIQWFLPLGCQCELFSLVGGGVYSFMWPDWYIPSDFSQCKTGYTIWVL